MSDQNKPLTPTEVKDLLKCAINQPESLEAFCCICGNVAEYELINDSKTGELRIIFYGNGQDKRLCRRCWEWNRRLEKILDCTIKRAWIKLLLIRIWFEKRSQRRAGK